MIQKVNLEEKFSLLNDYWSPKIASQINNFAIKLVKIQQECRLILLEPVETLNTGNVENERTAAMPGAI
jgi:hypothetical protein